MSNPKYKLTTPCPCCNSQVTVESYTDQPPKIEAVPSPVSNLDKVKINPTPPPKPTGVAEAMTNIANSSVNILGSDSFAYADKGWAHDWGKWNPVGIYETLEQRRSRLLEEKITNLQRTIGTQSESLVSAHEKIKAVEKSANSAHKRITELERRSSTPAHPPENLKTDIGNVRIDNIEKLATLVSIAGDYETIKNVLEGYFTVKDNEVEKWRKMMQVKADKLNEITAIVYPVYEQDNPQKMNPSEVYDGIKQIIMRPEIHPATKKSWAH